MKPKRLTRNQKIKLGFAGVLKEKAKRVELERKRKTQKLNNELQESLS